MSHTVISFLPTCAGECERDGAIAGGPGVVPWGSAEGGGGAFAAG